jgi:cobalt-zinc-cadmium efflux system protein
MGPQRPFVMALGITIALLAVEAVGGWLTGSLALLADAGHLLADVATLGIGFLGTWLASRPAPPKCRTGTGGRRFWRQSRTDLPCGPSPG